jgi:hypothetical protein
MLKQHRHIARPQVGIMNSSLRGDLEMEFAHAIEQQMQFQYMVPYFGLDWLVFL